MNLKITDVYDVFKLKVTIYANKQWNKYCSDYWKRKCLCTYVAPLRLQQQLAKPISHNILVDHV